MTFVLEIAVTAPSPLSVPGFGLATRLHAAPSQCSIRVRPVVMIPPTAHASVAEVALTPSRTVSPATVGVAARLHAAPSQCSTRPRTWLQHGELYPTAQASVLDVAATLWRKTEPATVAAGTMVQLPDGAALTGPETETVTTTAETRASGRQATDIRPIGSPLRGSAREG